MNEFTFTIVLITHILTALTTWYFVTRKKEKECSDKIDNVIEIFTMKDGNASGCDKFNNKITFRRKHDESS